MGLWPTGKKRGSVSKFQITYTTILYLFLRKVKWFLFAYYTLWGYNRKMKAEIKKQLVNRLKRIEGQVRGLEQMVLNDKYCIDIITQSNAVRKALLGVENIVLENHLSTHVIDQIKQKEEDRAIKEILKVYKLSNNK